MTEVQSKVQASSRTENDVRFEVWPAIIAELIRSSNGFEHVIHVSVFVDAFHQILGYALILVLSAKLRRFKTQIK